MGKIKKNYLYNLVYNLLVLFVPLVTAPYLARTLGDKQIGVYGYVSSATAVIVSVSLLGIYGYGNRQIAYVRDDKPEMCGVFSDLIFLRLIMGTVGSILYFAVAYCSDYFQVFMVYYGYYLATVLDCSWLFVGVEDMKIPTMKNILAKILSVGGIFLWVKSEDDLVKYVLVLAGFTLLANLSVYPQVKKYVEWKKPRVRYFRKYIKGTVVLCLPSLVSTIYMQMDKLMMEYLIHDTRQIAYYDQAEKIVMIPLTFITVLSTVMMPRIANEFYKKNDDIITKLLKEAGQFSLFLACPLCFGIAAIAGSFIPWYLGAAFKKSISVIVILSPVIISNTLIGISGTQYFTATNQINILLKSNILGAVINVAINLVLIPKWGCQGAAFATLVSNYVLVIVQYYYLMKQVEFYTVFRKSAKYLFFSVVMFSVVHVIGQMNEAGIWVTLVQIVIGAFIYMGLAVVTRDEMMKKILEGIWKKK